MRLLLRSSKETIDGTRTIYFKSGFAFMEQKAPIYKATNNELQEILESLNLSKGDLLNGHPPTIVNTGNSFLIVQVGNSTALKSLHPNLEKVKTYSEKQNLIGYYVFAPPSEPSIAATARMFAPLYGIDEESATGMAAGPLACYLFDNHFTTETELIIKQGDYMTIPSPSLIYVNLEVEQGKIKQLFTGGDAFVKDEKIIRLYFP
jgi:PhzF family phenazine biosynthesis protein